MARVREEFNELRKKKKKAFIPYITFGFPDIKTSESIILALDKANASFIEIGLPFSDPIADGPIIQTSSKVALDKGATIYNLFSSLKRIKKKITTPLILMTYYNPVYHMGLDTFFSRAKSCIDGIIIADLLAEEAEEFVKKARSFNIDTIFFVSPTTQINRLKLIERRTTGFIYYISITGVTGPRKTLPSDIFSHIRQIKRTLHSPICVGFGISTPKQAARYKRYFDGVIVGSAIIAKILKIHKQRNFLKQFRQFVLWLNG